jgi:hypothetical protein
MGWSGVDGIGLAQDRNRWRVLMNSVMHLGFHKMLGKVSSGLSSSATLHGGLNFLYI